MSRGAVVDYPVVFTSNGKEHTVVIEIEVGGDELEKLVSTALYEHFLNDEGCSHTDATKLADEVEWNV